MDAKRRGKFKGADNDVWMGKRGWRRPIKAQLRIRLEPQNKSIDYVLDFLCAQSEMAYSGNKRHKRTYYNSLVHHIPTFKLNLAAD